MGSTGATDGAGAPDLEVSVLGPLRARRDGVELALGGRRQRAVLARLALAGGRVVAVDRLVDELWDGAPPAQVTGTLQTYVSHLRRILGGPEPVIERAADGYRLRTEAVVLTAERAEGLVTAAMAGTTGPGDRLAAIESALALWHGTPLGDLADEPWARGEAARLAEVQLGAEEARFDLLLDLGRHAAAVADLDLVARSHPLRERFTAQLAIALYRCGRQAEALRAIDRLRTHLAEELGLDPGPDVARLEARVLAQDPALSFSGEIVGRPSEVLPRGRGGAGLGAVLPPAVTERRSRSGFVGRAAELDRLRAAWTDVAAGGRHLALLAGEPGAGKSRLARQLARWVHDEGGLVLWGRCTAENLVAYQPVVEALRTAARPLAPEAAAGLARDRPPLAVLVPDLAGDGPGAGPGLAERVERWDLFEAVADLLEDVTATTPLLLVIDDVHWADASTLALLDHLVRQGRRARTLVVATTRHPSGRPTPALDQLVVALRRDDLLTEVPVAGLGAAEVADLLDGRGVAVTRDEAGALRDRTGGNPFFLEALVDHGGLEAADPRRLPASVRDVLDERLLALGDDALHVLSAGAVIGARCDLAVLGAVVDLGPEALLDVVDAAVATHLLVEDEELGWVGFPHALVRSALISRLTRNREARLHLRIAEVVEARPAHLDREATVAQHLLAAGPLAPAPRTAAAAVAAGRRALTGLADEDALAWAGRALDVLASAGPEGAAVRLDALLLRAEAGRLVGDLGEVVAALDEAVGLAGASDDAELRLRVASEAVIFRTGGSFPWGLDPPDAAFEALVADVPATLPSDRRTLMLAWGTQSLLASDRHAVAMARSAEAITGLDALHRPNDRVNLLMTRRQAIAGPAGLAERLAMHPIALDPAVDDYGLRVGVLTLVEAHLWEAGRVAEARAAHQAVHAYMDPHPRPWYDPFLWFADGMVAYLEGDPDRGRELFERGLAIGEPAHAGPTSQFGIGLRVMDARARGAEASLRDLADDVRSRRPDLPAGPALDARVLLAEGDDGAARSVVATALAAGDPTGSDADLLWYLTVELWAEVAWLLGDAALGRVVATAVAPYADRIGVIGQCSLATGPLHRPHGLALAATGDVDAALAALDRAAAVGRSAALGAVVTRAESDRAALLA